ADIRNSCHFQLLTFDLKLFPKSPTMPNIPLRNGGPKARIAVIPGDGIGREVTPVAVQVIRAATAKRNRPLEFVEFDWGADKYLSENVSLPDGAVEMLRDEFDAILFGALGDPRVPSNQHAAEILLGLRFKLDLYVNARPTELLHPRFTPLRDRTPADINFMVIRENTEGLYAGVGGFFKKGTPDEIAVQEDINSRKGVERIIRHAFAYARSKKLKRVCMSDKSNALTFAHDLWQRVFNSVRPQHRREGHSQSLRRSPGLRYVAGVFRLERRIRAVKAIREVRPCRKHHH